MVHYRTIFTEKKKTNTFNDSFWTVSIERYQVVLYLLLELRFKIKIIHFVDVLASVLSWFSDLQFVQWKIIRK